MCEEIERKFKKCRIIIACLSGLLALWLWGCFTWLGDVSWFEALLIIYIPFFVVTTINCWIIFVEMEGGFAVELSSLCIYTIIAIAIMINKDIAGVFLSIITCILAIIIFIVAYCIPSAIVYLYTKKAWAGDAQRQYDLGIILMKMYKYGDAVEWFEKSAAQEFADAALKLNMCRKKAEEYNRKKPKEEYSRKKR
ncbi:MAG: hypothetical protein LBC48_09320 [Dysgonamonadaceae bacterium]|jgi:hypothetical protein|nr:hypothetical protein [Dysgonamonadaceae bacterium]